MTESTRGRISFAGIGVQKSASGWMFRGLEAHPGVATPMDPARKEVNYFNYDWHLGHGWYEALFPPLDHRVRGEFSVLYAASADVPERIRRYNPDMRLVLCLRDPIDRAMSQHRYLVGRGLVPDRLRRFTDAWEENPSYAEQSLYADVVERFRQAFPAEQLLVLDYDDVRRDPGGVLSRLFDHVGVDPRFRPATVNSRYNQSRRPRSSLAGRALRAGRLLPAPVVRRVRRTAASVQLRDLLTEPVGEEVVPPLTGAERTELRAFFRADVERIGELVPGVGASWLRDDDDRADVVR